MQESGNRLQQQQTDQPTIGHQQEAIKDLAQAAAAAQKAMKQQQEEQQAQAAAKQGAPKPNQQKNGKPQQAFTRLEGVGISALSANSTGSGKFGGLTPRAQRTMREGQQEKVSAEYTDLVKQYFTALGEKKR